MMPLMKLTNHLREIRRAKNLSGYDLQILTGTTAQVIYMIERGLRRPSFQERLRIAEALELTVDEIFPENLRRPAEQKIMRDDCEWGGR